MNIVNGVDKIIIGIMVHTWSWIFFKILTFEEAQVCIETALACSSISSI